jgi:hypothetical protein
MKSFRLLVEGSDDRHLIGHLLQQHGVSLASDEIQECDGVEALLNEKLPVLLKGSYTSIGIVVDADLDVQSRWQSIRGRLRQSGYEVPATPGADGLIVRDRQPAVGVWIMPDNVLPGMLEDFVRQLVPPGDDLWPLAERSVAAIPAPSRRFNATAERKAEIHTYLAWQEQPGTRMGSAIANQYFEANARLAITFVEWFTRLRTGLAR